MEFMNPKFYIKHNCGQFSIEHRLTHTYIETVADEKELVARVKYWNGLSEKELWEWLMYERFVRTPQTVAQATAGFTDKRIQESEEWYKGAWSSYTKTFYKKRPKLYVEDGGYPMGVITEIRREKYQYDKELDRLAKLEREEIEKQMQEEAASKRAADRVKVDLEEGSFGSISAMERLKSKERKARRVVKVKSKTKKTIVVSASDDLFA